MQNLYTASKTPNTNVDFLAIVAAHCGVTLTETVVAQGSDLDKQLAKRGASTYPCLEVDADTVLTDTHAIAAFICRSSGHSDLLGKTPAQEAVVDTWMDFMRTETAPIVNSLKWFAFGHAPCTTAEFNHISGLYKDNLKVLNKHLNGKSGFTGDALSICDLYICCLQVEMMQCLMDTNFRNSINFLNNLFKAHCDTEPFKARFGAIRQGKKQLMPAFSDGKK